MRYSYIELIVFIFLTATLTRCGSKAQDMPGSEVVQPIDSTFVNPVWDGADPWMVKKDWILYHSKKTTEPGWDRDIRMQQFHWKSNGSPGFGEPTPAGVTLERPSGEVAIEKELQNN